MRGIIGSEVLVKQAEASLNKKAKVSFSRYGIRDVLEDSVLGAVNPSLA